MCRISGALSHKDADPKVEPQDTMFVSMWMTSEPISVPPTTTVDAAATTMTRSRIRHLPITDANNVLVGIVAKQDILHAAAPDRHPFSAQRESAGTRANVAEIMHTSVKTVEPHTSIANAARLMREWKIGALPVINKKKLVGIITETDVLDALVAILSCSDPCVTVTMSVSYSSSEWLDKIIAVARTSKARLLGVNCIEHDGRHLAVARLVGDHSKKFIDRLWNAGLTVLSVQVENEPTRGSRR